MFNFGGGGKCCCWGLWFIIRVCRVAEIQTPLESHWCSLFCCHTWNRSRFCILVVCNRGSRTSTQGQTFLNCFETGLFFENFPAANKSAGWQSTTLWQWLWQRNVGISGWWGPHHRKFMTSYLLFYCTIIHSNIERKSWCQICRYTHFVSCCCWMCRMNQVLD